METLDDKLVRAVELSWRLLYKNRRKDGTYHEPRDADAFTEEEWDLISGHADGLVMDYAYRMRDGRCSLQASIDFDVAAFEENLDGEIAAMGKMLEAVPPVEVCTDEYLLANGWKP